MRVWPRSMTAQLLALLLLGLVAAHLIGLLLVQPNGTRIHVISRDQMAEHAAVAWRLAQDWDATRARFTKVLPRAYARVVRVRREAEDEGLDLDSDEVWTRIMEASNG